MRFFVVVESKVKFMGLKNLKVLRSDRFYIEPEEFRMKGLWNCFFEAAAVAM